MLPLFRKPCGVTESSSRPRSAWTPCGRPVGGAEGSHLQQPGRHGRIPGRLTARPGCSRGQCISVTAGSNCLPRSDHGLFQYVGATCHAVANGQPWVVPGQPRRGQPRRIWLRLHHEHFEYCRRSWTASAASFHCANSAPVAALTSASATSRAPGSSSGVESWVSSRNTPSTMSSPLPAV